MGSKSPLTKITESPGEHKIPKYEVQILQNDSKERKTLSKRSSPDTNRKNMELKVVVKKPVSKQPSNLKTQEETKK